MTLTVLSVAYSLAPVGPDAVGGAEQVLSQLDAALVAAGHRSIVVARAGSAASGELVATPAPQGIIDEEQRRAAQAAHRRAIAAVLAREPVDIVHLHGLDFPAYLPPPGPSVLITLHLPLGFYPAAALAPARPRTFLHCVSAAQRRSAPAEVDFLPEIENGVAVEALAARHGKRRFALTLGRICPEKGFHLALEAAARAALPLLIAGKVFPYPEHRRYFATAIAPRLGAGARFLGPIGFARKRRLLSAARCLLMPSLAAETSSLVAMEALACGTPVIAFPAGALPEIVEHGRTGFLVADAGEMTEAIARVASIDPEACRTAARARFSAARTVRRYLALYEALAAGETPRRPTA